jgi:hypothetical protein
MGENLFFNSFPIFFSQIREILRRLFRECEKILVTPSSEIGEGCHKDRKIVSLENYIFSTENVNADFFSIANPFRDICLLMLRIRRKAL